MKTTTKAYNSSKECHVGIDVGKGFINICVYELNCHWQIENNNTGIRLLLHKLNRYKLTLIVVEATGGYELLLVEFCAKRSFPIIVGILNYSKPHIIHINHRESSSSFKNKINSTIPNSVMNESYFVLQ